MVQFRANRQMIESKWMKTLKNLSGQLHYKEILQLHKNYSRDYFRMFKVLIYGDKIPKVNY